MKEKGNEKGGKGRCAWRVEVPGVSATLHSTPLIRSLARSLTSLSSTQLNSTQLYSTPLHTALRSTPLPSTPLARSLHSTALHSTALDHLVRLRGRHEKPRGKNTSSSRRKSAAASKKWWVGGAMSFVCLSVRVRVPCALWVCAC